MKTSAVFKRAHNQWLSRLGGRGIGLEIGSERYWSETLGVSRTTIRSILAALAAKGILAQDGRRKILLRHPAPTDLYPDLETEQLGTIVEKRFMKWILHGDCKPGQQINGLELARQFGVSTSAIRDYLNRFSRFGLLERRPSGSWAFKGFTSEFAEELFEVREMFELRSAQRFVGLAADDPVWEASASSRSISSCSTRRKTDLPTSQSSTSGFIALSTTFRAIASSSASTISYP
jgi:DNA-binding GntR family transcriptional regulator